MTDMCVSEGDEFAIPRRPAILGQVLVVDQVFTAAKGLREADSAVKHLVEPIDGTLMELLACEDEDVLDTCRVLKIDLPRTATFARTQVKSRRHLQDATRHHDALLIDGFAEPVLLEHLPPGLSVKVIDVPSAGLAAP